MSCKKSVTGVTLDKTTLNLVVNSTETLTATVIPDNASNKNVKWQSDNSSVATVNNGIVTAKTVGKATITVTTEDGNKTASCIVTVITSQTTTHLGEPELVSVEGGTFSMGCDTPGYDCMSEEKPVRQVTLSSFKIGKYEVTQGQWKAVMGNNPSYNSQAGDDYPVENVSWDEVHDFIKKLNNLTGKQYHLPTEAEWEYAARGGNKGGNNYKYSGGNTVNDVAWHGGNSGSSRSVGEKKANELGIYDMSGNVKEWCSDWYALYPANAETNPTGPSLSSGNRICRGGSWGDPALNCRVAARAAESPYTSGNEFIGFRLVHH